MLNTLNRHAVLVGALTLLGLPMAAGAQPYPGHAVKIVVPYPPGSSPDALARVLSENLSRRINQPVVVENRPGAGGMIGAKLVSEAAPDGNTLLMYTPAWPAAKVFLKKPLVPVPDGLEPVTLVGEGRFAFTASAGLPAKNFHEMVAYAKANPGKLNFATTGPGDALLYFHTVKVEKDIRVETVQYKGSSEYLTALMANDVQLAFPPEYSVLPFVREGKLKVLAVTGDKRSKAYPDVPTFKELGLPKIRNTWMSVFAPRGTPPELVQKIYADLSAIIKSPEGGKRIQDIFFDPIALGPEPLRQRIQNEIEEWSQLAKTVGLQPE